MKRTEEKVSGERNLSSKITKENENFLLKSMTSSKINSKENQIANDSSIRDK